MKHLSRFFTVDELACRCGCGFGTKVEHYHPMILERADLIRDAVNRPLHPTSGARCAAHNRVEEGSPTSAHLIAAAIDFRARSGADRLELVEVAIEFGNMYGVKHIGAAHGFIHVDTDGARPDKLWTY